MEEKRNLNKRLYLVELKLLKVLPVVLALVYFVNTVFSVFNIDLPILSYIGGVSFIPLLFMYISSYTFQFCEYHRLPLHYIVLNNILSIIGYKLTFCTAWFLIILHILLFGIIIFLSIYLHLNKKRNERFGNTTI